MHCYLSKYIAHGLPVSQMSANSVFSLCHCRIARNISSFIEPRCNYNWPYNCSILLRLDTRFMHLIKIVCMCWYTIWLCTSWYERKYNLDEKLHGSQGVLYFISSARGCFQDETVFFQLLYNTDNVFFASNPNKWSCFTEIPRYLE